jgi:hypothetical protein
MPKYRARVLYNFILVLFKFFWSKHIIYNASYFLIVNLSMPISFSIKALYFQYYFITIKNSIFDQRITEDRNVRVACLCDSVYMPI